jgi:very-short-patch-repair endonuclease
MTRKNRPLLHHARAMRRAPTPAENRIWQWLRGQRFGVKFRRQVPIGPFIVDFYCAELKLVIEIDGSSHQWRHEYDDVRTLELYTRGIRVFRIANEELRDPEMVGQQIKWMIAQCARPPHPPSAPSPPRGGGEGR